jgi:Protein of unknown function (DUF3822)
MMEKVILDITVQDELPKAFLEHAQRYLVIGRDRISYLISDTREQIIAVKAQHLDYKIAKNGLEQAFAKDDLMAHQYAGSTVGVLNRYHTIVPNRMFDISRLPAYFTLLSSIGQDKNAANSGGEYQYHFDDLPFLDAKLVYAIEPEVAAFLDKYLPKAQVCHQMTAFIQACRAQCHASTFNTFVHVFQHDIVILIFEGMDLIFFNTYSFSSPSDFVYFIMLPLKQLKIDPLQTSAVISGEITEDSDCLMLARRFMGPFRFQKAPHMFEYPGAIESLPSHFCFDLYSLKLKK